MALTCGWCSEQVIPDKEVNWGLFSLLLLLGLLGGILYLIYWAGKPGMRCPLCNGDVYGRVGEPAYIDGVHYYHNQAIPEDVIQAEINRRVARARERRVRASSL